MSSYFTLELDTTAPQIEIYSPNYTTPTTLTEIVVKANESLLDNAEIYLIDGQGVRHDYIFFHNDDEFVGHVYFNDVALGIATIYACVYDEVLNKSDLISHSFNIIKSEILKVKIISTSIQDVDINILSNNIIISSKKLSPTVDEKIMTILANGKVMKVGITTKISEVQ